MATMIDLVRRGDLITSAKFNEIAKKLYELETRIEDLESGQPAGARVVIDSFVPPTEQHIDRTLEIHGDNFEIPPEKNTVKFDGVPVTRFGLSTTKLLRVTIPRITGVPKNALISLENVNGEVNRLYRVLEEVPVSGDPPTITSITHATTHSTVLKPGEGFVIAGTNFASTPQQNQLRLRSREPGHETEEYPITAITTGSSNTTQITATLPTGIALVQEPLFPGGPVRPDNMEIELIVGAHDAVLFPVNVSA